MAWDRKTGQEKEIFHSAETCRFSPQNMPVSPDGKWLAFTRDVLKEEGGRPGYTTLLLSSTAGGPVRQVIKLVDEGAADDRYIRTTGWSPDSKFLYYAIFGKGNTMWQVAVDGGEPTETRLPLGEFSRDFIELSFHPDGKRVAFVVPDSSPSEVWVLENFLQPKPNK